MECGLCRPAQPVGTTRWSPKAAHAHYLFCAPHNSTKSTHNQHKALSSANVFGFNYPTSKGESDLVSIDRQYVWKCASPLRTNTRLADNNHEYR
ncbi:hypothetical protein DdX_02462 [Ditylenchus destructor]|uniref:Uncharacterized protein n=1 Tax=Ditylenchus destructor TaxID=166010 RepID=A0AAD4NB84_9BILA|nr:hypothetical protein DdX_02462 [Ditylenchus destructor]